MVIVIPKNAYPLTWPSGIPRTPEANRKSSTFGKVQMDSFERRKRFGLNNGHGLTKVRRELKNLGALMVLISSNLQLRTDGLPYADGPQNPEGDVGAAVYWTRNERRRGELVLAPYCIPCDRWDRIADNLYAIGMSIEALRGMDRWGCVSVEQAFAGFAALPPGSGEGTHVATRPWREVLGGVWPEVGEFEGSFNAEELLALAKIRHRKLIATAHPDRGGSDDQAAELNVALANAELELVGGG